MWLSRSWYYDISFVKFHFNTKSMVSILILTKNEAQDLPRCLNSVSWSDDVHVLDSYSDDNTVQIAKEMGAKVTQRKFDGYATQRNAGLLELAYQHDWIFILDADEVIPVGLVEEIKRTIGVVSGDVNGFRIRRRDFLGNTWLKRAQITPYYIRLVKKGKAHYHREINEVIEVNGEVQQLDGYFDHYPFSKGFAHWLAKHNQYSTMEAQRWVEEHQTGMSFSLKKALFSHDFSEKRYHQKGLFYKIPFRPFLKWCYIVFARRAFLDGKAGVIYASLQAIYEYFIVLKTKELLKEID